MLPTEDSENYFETLRVMLPITIQTFFDTFIADNAVYGWSAHCQKRGDTEIETTGWVNNPELKAVSRELKYRVKLTGVGPSSTRVHRTQIYNMSDSNLTIKMSSKAIDVPYGSYFTVEDEWNISKSGDSEDKIMLKC